MAGPFDMAVQLASNAARIGWFYGINRIVADRLTAHDEDRPKPADSSTRPPTPKRAMPSRAELFAALRDLMIEDANDARSGIHRATGMRPDALPRHLMRLAAMFRDLDDVARRRSNTIVDTVHAHAAGRNLPDYYTQDFHFQSGGHLTEGSAAIYDVQVDTLFYGSGDLMRRAGLRPIASYMAGRDQRHVSLLDVACGTGRFMRDVRLTYPRMRLAGIDLSDTYLDEARRFTSDLTPIAWQIANAEALRDDAVSHDIVTSIFLFHELPGAVRHRVMGEIGRVLKPGGLFVLVDSLQDGDRDGWDGLLEAFPERFHEPYYRHYLGDDLISIAAQAGLRHETTRLAFLSKVMSFRKIAQ